MTASASLARRRADELLRLRELVARTYGSELATAVPA